MIDLVECDLCEQETDDLQETECGRRFCTECDRDGAVFWTSCDELGEEWAHLA